jgi:hypothetical protein
MKMQVKTVKIKIPVYQYLDELGYTLKEGDKLFSKGGKECVIEKIEETTQYTIYKIKGMSAFSRYKKPKTAEAKEEMKKNHFTNMEIFLVEQEFVPVEEFPILVESIK